MKEQKKLIPISIVLFLMVMLMSLNVFSGISTKDLKLDVGKLRPPEESIALDLTLPEPIELEHKGITMYAWNMEGYAAILRIFNGYTLLADNYIAESEKDSLWQIRLDICEQNKQLEANNFNLAIDHRDRLYELWYSEQIDYKKDKARNAIKSVLIATGVGVVGVATGILIGFFAKK